MHLQPHQLVLRLVQKLDLKTGVVLMAQQQRH